MVGRPVVGERADARWNADPSDTAADCSKSCFLENFPGRSKHFNAGDPVFLNEESPSSGFAVLRRRLEEAAFSDACVLYWASSEKAPDLAGFVVRQA